MILCSSLVNLAETRGERRENPPFSCWQIRKIIEQRQKKSEISKNIFFDRQLGMYDDAYQV